MMKTWMAASTAAILAAMAATPAAAVTEADCERAVAQTQNEMRSNPGIQMRPDSMTDMWSERILSASGDGVRGNPERCIGRINEVRAEMNLKPIPK
ncbi:MAG: hypothetical protein AAGJ94_12220 [Pseudomonadota bacterium]